MKQICSLIFAIVITCGLYAQKGSSPYKLKASVDFKSPKKHKILDPIGYGKDGIIQFNGRGVKSFSLQKFSTNLRLMKETKVEIGDRLNKHVKYERMVKFKTKTYLFVRDVNKKNRTEGITALEFSPKMMNFVGKGKNLFQSSDKVIVGGKNVMTGEVVENSSHEFTLSNDSTKFMCTYSLVPRTKSDKKNKEVVGIHVFDEMLNKVWGGEFEMPYTEAMMDNLGFTLCSDGTVYLLTMVHNGEKKRKSKDSYHFEVFQYGKDKKKPKGIKLDMDGYFPQSAYIYEGRDHKIVVAGYYATAGSYGIDGAYLMKLDINEKGGADDIMSKFHPIPEEVIKAYVPKLQKEKKGKKSKKGEDEENAEDEDYVVNNLEIRDIHKMPNGSFTIVSEIYFVTVTTHYNGKTTTTEYDTYAKDIFIMNIDSMGEMLWVKKLPKNQHSNDKYGFQLSLRSCVIGDNLHIFYVDNPKNLKLKVTEAPARHENKMGGYLIGVLIDPSGEMKKYDLGEIAKYETNFYIRQFVNGGSNNLIKTCREKK